MSFPVVASYNTSPNMFGPSYEELDSEFFDQFLTFSPNHNGEYPLAPEATIDYVDSGDASGSSHDDDMKNLSEHGSWPGEGWTADFGEASLDEAFSIKDHDFYSELSGRAAISDSELLSLEGITLDSPIKTTFSQISLPSTPYPSVAAEARRKSRVAESISNSLKKATTNLERTLRSPIRKQSATKLTRHSNHSQKELEQLDDKFHLDALKFKFDFEENPSSLCLLDNFPIMEAIKLENIDTQDSSILASPLDTPELCGNHSRKVSQNSMLPTPELQSTAAFWPETASPSFSPATYDSATFLPTDPNPPMRWNHASKAPLAHPLPTGYHTNPQLATKSLALQLQNGLAHDSNANDFSSLQARRHNPMINNSGLMIQMPPQYSTQPQIHHHQQQQQQMHQPQFTSENARISRGYYIPPSAQPRPTHQNHHRRHTSHASPRQSSHAETPSARKWRSQNAESTGGMVDFVNYTPDDSKKILTGVAPSGSSKTKARREKEAMEKRRRLTQAAARAIRAVGGNIDRLVEEGLLV
ncbi:hypothetical protein HYALB_00002472 [Hymenoscyphus albidus]|uniref:Developmental regulatory protein wetA n=1 Tax=Hymenoscyphus albidus TaxID=595503 RepID=A0A9N9LVJ0_9HELO|nr:hypothetical protein HYALB_00002472 [Hymenoscyphus albidus]